MAFGIEIFDENSVRTLGMEDFTLKKIFETEIPARPKASGANVRSDMLIFNIPGYNQETCFVVITPKTFMQGTQNGYSDGPYTPYYVDLGGESIGVLTYFQTRSYYYGGAGGYSNLWFEWTALSVLEVYEAS